MNGKGECLLDAGFVNAVVILVIVTCVLGPLLTERFAARLAAHARGETWLRKVVKVHITSA